ncbi:MAG: hypothetical protein U1F43_20905 [Myxococcota bacterium]
MSLEEIDAKLDKIPATERKALIADGRRFGSESTQAQARKTINAHATFAAQVEARGFPAKKLEELKWCDAALTTAGVGREATRIGAKTTNVAVLDAMQLGKGLRFDLVAILSGAADDLARTEDGSGAALAKEIEVTLAHTGNAGVNPLIVADQLDLLTALANKDAVKAVLDAGSAATVTEAQAASAKIRQLEAATVGPSGTPAETQRLDLIDGLIIRLARQARKAARAAAHRLGDPAIAKAYQLTELYGERSTPKPATTTTTTPVS